MEDASRSGECDVELSEEEDNCKILECADVIPELDDLRLPVEGTSVVEGDSVVELVGNGVKVVPVKDKEVDLSEAGGSEAKNNKNFFAPTREEGKVVVKPPKEAIEAGILKWSPSLRTMDSMWAQYGKMEVFLGENGLYLFRFADERTRDKVMEAKLWHIANKPLILRKWTPASGVGKPLCVDSVTEDQLRLGFARVLVEVDIDSDFPREVEVVGADGGRVAVGIEYPWLPIKCKKCKSFGHLAHACTKVEKQVWIPKRTEPVQQELQKQVGVGSGKTIGVQIVSAPRVAAKDQWTEVRSAKRTPISKPSARDNLHWTNSFHLLARADGRGDADEVKGAGAVSNTLQKVIEYALNEESANLLVDKGKGKMGEEEEVLMRGSSPTA
ncbi:uncharacterized protein LOC132165089 [Corylus avellana]|uniref:uncharacterized protein LOC132165089 n=1 Tax=Corylus avellana TaxID=13451 RepID=UPI00286ADED3|nr:uncharacterized protein LOC132165089 [Corylus avellana]